MRPEIIINRIRSVGGTVRFRDADLDIEVDLSRLRQEEADWLQSNEESFSTLLGPHVEADDPDYPYRWTGQRLGSEIGIDTETTLIDANTPVPALVMISVSDGDQSFVLRPEQLPEFLHLHADARFIMYNAAFDYLVIEQYLGSDARGLARTG